MPDPAHSSVHIDNARPTIGLVLGAGGVRGCAHAGVASVLGQHDYPVDLIVGASVGSLFGLGMAAGLPTERIAQAARDATPYDLFRFYTGRLRTDRKNPVARLALEAGEGKSFEDLKIPFAVVATDMSTGRATVFDRGPVLPVIEASIALPFVARPVRIGQGVYVDGGLLDTAPVNVARAMGADKVIAVCLGYNYAAPRLLLSRPWTHHFVERLGRQKAPAGETLRDQVRFGCRLFAATYDPPLPARDADVAIWPDLNSVNPNSFFGARFCFDQGVRAAQQSMRDLEKLLRSQSLEESRQSISNTPNYTLIPNSKQLS